MPYTFFVYNTKQLMNAYVTLKVLWKTIKARGAKFRIGLTRKKNLSAKHV